MFAAVLSTGHRASSEPLSLWSAESYTKDRVQRQCPPRGDIISRVHEVVGGCHQVEKTHM